MKRQYPLQREESLPVLKGDERILAGMLDGPIYLSFRNVVFARLTAVAISPRQGQAELLYRWSDAYEKDSFKVALASSAVMLAGRAGLMNATVVRLCLRQKSGTRRKRLLLLAAVYITVAAAIHQLNPLDAKNARAAVQTLAEVTVSVVHPERVGAVTLARPWYTAAYTEAPIYAQTSGYLKKWYFDIGGKVKANDILAEIDTPEVDQQLAQAKAQLQVAQSAAQLALVTYQRDQTLFEQKVLDAQTRDTAADTYQED
jgi:hypothetical protein